MAALPQSLVVLRQRDFRLVFGAFAVSVLADRMVSIALAFAVLELGGSPSGVGSSSRRGRCHSSGRSSSAAWSPIGSRAAW